MALSLWHIEGWTPRAHIDFVGRAAVLAHVQALVFDLVGHAEEAGLCANQSERDSRFVPTPSLAPLRTVKNGNIRHTTQAVMTTCADEEVSRAVAASN